MKSVRKISADGRRAAYNLRIQRDMFFALMAYILTIPDNFGRLLKNMLREDFFVFERYSIQETVREL